MLSDGCRGKYSAAVERHGRRFIDLYAPLVGGQVNFRRIMRVASRDLLYESAQSPRTLEAKISFSPEVVLVGEGGHCAEM